MYMSCSFFRLSYCHCVVFVFIMHFYRFAANVARN